MVMEYMEENDTRDLCTKNQPQKRNKYVLLHFTVVQSMIVGFTCIFVLRPFLLYHIC